MVDHFLVRTQDFPKNYHFLPSVLKSSGACVYQRVRNVIFQGILRTCYMNDPWTFLHWIPTENRNKVKIYPENVFC